MYLGLNLSHDSSVSLHNKNGQVIFAIAEERINRIKGFWGVPRLAIQLVMNEYMPKIERVFVGSHSVIAPQNFLSLQYVLNSKSDSFFDLANEPIPVGWFSNLNSLINTSDNDLFNENWFVREVERELSKLGVEAPITLRNHHDSHAFSTIIGSGFDDALVVTLDGEGDGESGSISVWSNRELSSLHRIPRNLSLGNFYSEITKRYGFRRAKHEGKLTGLAARGQVTIALEILSSFFYFSQGNMIKDRFLGNKFDSVLRQIENHDNRNFEEALIDILAITSEDYASLATNAQKHLENNVLQLINYWKKQTGKKNLCLAGGVFANVKLNQSIIETLGFRSVYVYPNMGDGGLAVGSVWGSLQSNGTLVESHESLFLGPDSSSSPKSFSSNIEEIVKDLKSGLIYGVFRGRSEWGPRALCNRSILASPTVDGISLQLNKRLQRTEFMPFAPIVSEKIADKVFSLSNRSHVDNYASMTTTVDVKKKWRNSLREVTNIDGTARPQIISAQDVDLTRLLDLHFEVTGCPVLINTSFNIHEQPIIETREHALEALRKERIDRLLLDGELLRRPMR